MAYFLVWLAVTSGPDVVKCLLITKTVREWHRWLFIIMRSWHFCWCVVAWMMASAALTVIALPISFVASIVTCVGLLLAYRRSSWRKRRSCFCSAAVLMFVAGMQCARKLNSFVNCYCIFGQTLQLHCAVNYCCKVVSVSVFCLWCNVLWQNCWS